MNQEKKSGWTGKGFYIVLLLCAAAIGVSSYVIFRNDGEEIPEAVSAVLEEKETAGAASEKTDVETEAASTASFPETAAAAGKKDEESTEASVEPVWQRPVTGAVTRSFSGDTLVYSSTLGDWRTHNGTDFATSVGSEVKAIGKGVVTEVGEKGVLGMTVVVEHTGGYQVVYANLEDTVACKVGDDLEAGDVIGTVGKTMLSEVGEQDHLHLEVLKSGCYIDPITLFGE